jgi:hypothetical protein
MKSIPVPVFRRADALSINVLRAMLEARVISRGTAVNKTALGDSFEIFILLLRELPLPYPDIIET